MVLAADTFFDHLESFFDYRSTVYEASQQTIKSNRIDLNSSMRRYVKKVQRGEPLFSLYPKRHASIRTLF